eukprot:Skav201532  [mRNA]  locus=scaffold1616:56234:61011:+ [translate_table: standard]
MLACQATRLSDGEARQDERSAPYIAGEAAYNQAHDAGLTKEDGQANGKVGEQITVVAADVLTKLAKKMEMTPEEEIHCSVAAAQAQGRDLRPPNRRSQRRWHTGQAAGAKAPESAAIEAANIGKALGMSGVDTAQAARRGRVLPATLRAFVSSLTVAGSVHMKLPSHLAEDTDDLSRGVESAMIYAGARAKGDEMADAAKEEGESVQGQVAAAADGAMDSMKDENAKISDVVSAAYKSAKETGLEEGMTEPAAQTAAVEAIKDELEKSGMSSAEATAISVSAATTATSVVVAPTVNIHGGGGKTGAAAVPPPIETPTTPAPVATLAPDTTTEPVEVTAAPLATVAPEATPAPVATIEPATTIAPATIAPVETVEAATIAPVATPAPIEVPELTTVPPPEIV